MTSRLLVLLLAAAACDRTADAPGPRADLESRSADARCKAAVKLWNTTREFAPGLELLLDHAGSDDIQSRRAAARHLPHAERIPADRIAKRAELELRRALRTLGAIGAQARAHAPLARAALDDPAPGIALTAAWALFRMTGGAQEPLDRLLAQLAAAGTPQLRATIADVALEISRQDPQPLIKALKEQRYATIARDLLAFIRKGDPGYAAAQAALAH